MKGRKVLIFTVLLVALFLVTGILAKPENNSVVQNRDALSKMTLTQVSRTLSNISNWSYWMHSSGKSGMNPENASGGTYPRGTAAVIFQDGFIWGAKMPDGEIRVGGQTYNVGTVPGWIDPDGTSHDATDERVKIWRIRPDYATLTHSMVRQDAAELNMVPAADVTEAMTQAVIDQYKEDWENWPGDLGAPYIDKNGNGRWDGSDIDEPGIANADQVVWFVCNDLNETAARSLHGSPPIGIELQVTAWAYAQPGARLGQIIFKRYLLINKSGKDIDEMYVAQWCDPDVGDAGNDLIGCDTTLSMGFAYNGEETDNLYAAYGLAPPAFGYDFFQGPLVKGNAGEDLNKNGVDDASDYGLYNFKEVGPGYINLPMTGFSWFAAGSPIDDPELGDYDGTLQWWNMLRGYLPTTDVDNPTPWTIGNISGGTPTKFPMAGDPVTETGDLDAHASYFSPSDRRMALCSGPFAFASGDTQEVVVAIVGGIGDSRLSSITDMKESSKVAQDLFDGAFEGVPKAPAGPKVTVRPFEDYILLEWGSDADAVAATEEPVIAGYSFEGYNLYQLPSATAPKDQATRIATFDKVNGVGVIEGKRFLPQYGQNVIVPIQRGADVGVQRHFKIEKDYITGGPLYEGTTYYFAVTAYNYNPEPEIIEDKALESALIALSATPQEPLPGDEVWDETDEVIPVEHIGTADAKVDITVTDPYEFTGHKYEVFFDQQHYYLDKDGNWKTTNYADSVGKALGKVADLTGTTISGIAYTSPTAGTRDLKFVLNLVSPDYDYSDGVKLTFPSDIVINGAENAIGNTYGEVFTPEIDPVTNSVFWGGPDTTGDGGFCGGEVFTVNVKTPTLPLDVDYIVWDDGWATGYGEPYASLGNGIVHAVGTCTITEEAYVFKTENHWNLKDVTLNTVLLEDQTVIDGVDIYTGEEIGLYDQRFVDGFLINVSGNYDKPTDFSKLEHVKTTKGTVYDIGSYAQYAWGWHGPTALATDTYEPGPGGSPDLIVRGCTDLNELQKDYELRFTGEYEWITKDGMVIGKIKDGTGSVATIIDARGMGGLADHPLNPNPGSDAYFTIRIPFEIWNIDDNQQVNMVIVDRYQTADQDTFYAFNPLDRMYTWICNKPYQETVLDPDGEDSDYLTWSLVFWETNWAKGDILRIKYNNPIQLGVDRFVFETVAPLLGDEDLAKEAVKKINVFPNPYYAYNSLSTNIYDNYVTFTHLPEKATIRIFTLAGIEVRKLEKTDPSTQTLKWDLKNEADLPVASGMYIAHVDMPDLDEEKILKLFIIQGEQILEYY